MTDANFLARTLGHLRRTQREALPRQVPNSAGGHAYPVDDRTRLHRFLILGSEGGSYYASERALTRESAAAVERLLASDGVGVVAAVVEVSRSGRAPKNDPALFVLALASALGDEATRRAAHAALPEVARTGTHLMSFADTVQDLRGWGRGLRRAVANWYARAPLDRLALQAVKYRQRAGWTHRDLLRLSHPVSAAEDTGRRALFEWIARGEAMDAGLAADLPPLVQAARAVAKAGSPAEAAALVRAHGLPREALPGELLREAVVWDALLADMPVTAMIRNLGKMTEVGLLAPGSEAAAHVAGVLGDAERLRAARVHPMAVLTALTTYARGRGLRGKLAWAPVAGVVDALDAAFYASFANVEPTGKRRLLALDVSGSMGALIAGSALSAREAAAAMALVTLAAEGQGRARTVAFAHRLKPLALSPRQRLDDVVRLTAGLPFGATDCALPMLQALRDGLEVDSFEVYTDSETWFGGVHPVDALRRYRDATGIAAKLVVTGMVSNGFSIADPADAGTLDVVGFDSGAPALIADFVRGGAERSQAPPLAGEGSGG